MTKDADGNEDFDAFFQRQKDFEAGLSAEDRAVLKEELKASDTPREQEYRQDQRDVRKYFELYDKVASSPRFRGMMEAHKAATVDVKKQIEKRDLWKKFEDKVREEKEAWRMAYPRAEKILLKHEYVTTPIREQKSGVARAGGSPIMVPR